MTTPTYTIFHKLPINPTGELCNLGEIYVCEKTVTFNAVEIGSYMRFFFKPKTSAPNIRYLNKRLTLKAGNYLIEFYSKLRKEFERLFVTPISEDLILGKRRARKFIGGDF